jgi:hypothetical protein
MRLLDTKTLEVKLFFQRQLPEYAILSHTWEDEEVTLQDMQSGVASHKKGYSKIQRCCQKAAEDGYAFSWIDTCCIDKTSSAELSEAINSMYKWYKDSSVCYAYLADLTTPTIGEFRSAKWFTRGWTLQELIAPRNLEFYTADWTEYGTKRSLSHEIATITGISRGVLWGDSPTRHTVAKRMSWAARRTTTRVEDEAYCLLGLFGVNIPLLYGEGDKAFRRLQEAIMREEEDYTLLTWQPSPLPFGVGTDSLGLLAHSPKDFEELQLALGATSSLSRFSCDWDKLSRSPLPLLTSSYTDGMPLALTGRGLRVSLPVKVGNGTRHEIIACLSTFIHSETGPDAFLLCLKLYARGTQGRYIRKIGDNFLVLPEQEGATFQLQTIYVEQPSSSASVSSTFDWRDLYGVVVLVSITNEPDLKHVTGVSASGAGLQQLSYVERAGLEEFMRTWETGSVGDPIEPAPGWPRWYLNRSRAGTALELIAFDDTSFGFLLEKRRANDWKEASIAFAIEGHPKHRFTVYLDIEREIPVFRLGFDHKDYWRGFDANIALTQTTHEGRGKRQWKETSFRDRAKLTARLMWSSRPSRQGISISLRRVSTRSSGPWAPRMVLAIETFRLPY